MIPVVRGSNDPHFRYKMQPVAVSQEASRVILTNLDAVAKSLRRDPQLVLRYLGSALGCTQGRDGSRYFLNGRFSAERLQALVYDFVDAYVLCQSCGNPETRFVGDAELSKFCSSCGATVPQPAGRLNAVIARDIAKGVNEDANYRQSSSADIQSLIRSEEDASGRLYDLYRQENLRLSDLFASYFRPSGLRQLSKVLAEASIDEILENIEGMLENEKREHKIDAFLKALCRSGYSIDDIAAYFSRPRRGRKRNALIKKEAEHFISSYEE